MQKLASRHAAQYGLRLPIAPFYEQDLVKPPEPLFSLFLFPCLLRAMAVFFVLCYFLQVALGRFPSSLADFQQPPTLTLAIRTDPVA
jgi:hypothetical protein